MDVGNDPKTTKLYSRSLIVDVIGIICIYIYIRDGLWHKYFNAISITICIISYESDVISTSGNILSVNHAHHSGDLLYYCTQMYICEFIVLTHIKKQNHSPFTCGAFNL